MKVYDSSQHSIAQDQKVKEVAPIVKEVHTIVKVENSYVLPKYVPIVLALLTILNLIILIK